MLIFTKSMSFVIRLGLVVAFGCVLANKSTIETPYTIQVSQLNIDKDVNRSIPIYRPTVTTDYSKLALLK